MHKRAYQLKPGDVMVLGTCRREHRVTGTSRAMPATSDRIAIIGERAPGSRSPVWYFDLNEFVEVTEGS